MEESTKSCCTCKQHKSLDKFTKNKNRPDGRNPRCKACDASYYQRNREKIIARVTQYKVDNREKVLERQRRYREQNPDLVREQKRKAYYQNLEHYRDLNRAYRIANRERIKEGKREWAASNPAAVQRIKSQYKHRRRALESSNGIYAVSARDLKRLLARSGGRCTYCTEPFDSNRLVTWDHIIPVTRGGTYSVGNLAPCCVSCNASKQNRTVTEWRLWQQRNAAATLTIL